MGKRGPKPKPTKLLVAAWRVAQRAGEPQPDALPVVPPAPPDFDADGARLWQSTAEMLHRAGILAETDLASLEDLISAQIEEAEMTAAICKAGLLVRGRDGSKHRNPLLMERNKVRQRIDRLRAEFGMTPSSRTRIRTEPKAVDVPTSATDELLNS